MKQNYKEFKFNAPHWIYPQELQNQIDKLLTAGIVKPIISKAPAFLVKKKDTGTYRLVVSYKKLNDRVECDQSRTNDLLRA